MIEAAEPYRVLARKYRPTTFADLIGQEAMVRTLSNAFAAGRVHQAYIFTGVRGVGKTTTARILARAFAYEREDGGGGPTVDLSTPGRHCQAIIEGRHPDVIEMDAASHTGIDDIRDIIASAQYRPMSARAKIFIIDEVHMLSKAAFNGLLKTLEEPPPHVKFLFATTEIRKVPVTILSRCQRFDLRRVEAAQLVEHLSGICAREGVAAEEEALRMIVRASEGSVRDALSLLDQAIAHAGAGSVAAEETRRMLGLADRARVLDLFEAVMAGAMDRALAEFKAQHDEGADPALIVTDLAEAVHLVTRLKLTPAALADPALGEDDRRRGAAFAKALPMRVLTRAWQMLLKGLAEVQQAPRPAVAAEMLIIRLAFAADLPTPDEAIRMLRDGASPGGGGPVQYAPAPGSGTAAAAPETKSAVAFAPPTADGPRMRISAGRPALAIASGEASIEPRERPPAPAARPAVTIESFAAFHALCLEKRDVATSVILENHVRPIRFAPGRFEFAVTADAPGEAANQVKRALDAHTGIRWAVSVAPDGGEPTIAEARGLRKEEERRGVLANPVVRAILERFPGAAVVAVRPIGPSAEEAAPPADAGEDDADLVGYDDAISDESFTEDDL